MNDNKKATPRKVNLTIRSEQYHLDTPPITIDSNTEGEMNLSPTGCKIVYREASETGLGNTITTIFVEGENNVRMERFGANTINMEFTKGKTHTSIMNTPYGSITISYLTSKVEADISESGGMINLTYSINSFGEYPVKTNLNISIDTKDQGEKYNWK